MKNLNRWIMSYIAQSLQSRPMPKGTVHVMFAFVDHYEPDWNKAPMDVQTKRVERWVREYPNLASQFRDADGRHPRHSFFYPVECYDRGLLTMMEPLVKGGFGEVEVHLHHDNDTAGTLKAKLEKAKHDLSHHGFLGKRPLSGHLRFAFIHGNWALNNSRSDGKWCGVNDESAVLADAGCYADFTFPSAPSETQPKKINSLYYTRSNPRKPKSHNRGHDVTVGEFKRNDLMIIQGPLTLNWKRRSRGIFPRIENGDINGGNPPTPDRVDLWVDQHIHVKGKPEWIFVKVHTHGAHETNADCVLGEPVAAMHRHLTTRYNDGVQYQLHYVSAREMFNIIKAAEAGEPGSPNDYRDYLIHALQ